MLELSTLRLLIVASRSTSRLVTCLGLFRLLMKRIFGPYVLWPFDKNLIFQLVTRISTRDFTVCFLSEKIHILVPLMLPPILKKSLNPILAFSCFFSFNLFSTSYNKNIKSLHLVQRLTCFWDFIFFEVICLDILLLVIY